MNLQRVSLEVIEVSKPCPAEWDAMAGDARTRFCEHCQKHVHNLSAMPLAEAERLVCESAGNLCVRFEREASGKVITLDYRPAPPRRWTWAWIGWSTAASVVLAAFNLSWIGRRTPPVMRTTTLGSVCVPTTRPAHRQTLGRMAAPTTQPANAASAVTQEPPRLISRDDPDPSTR